MSLANYGAKLKLSPQQIADLIVVWRTRHRSEVKPYQISYTVSKVLNSYSVRRPLTDLGNAERFIDRYGDDLIYVEELNQWWSWDGKKWDHAKKHDIQERIIATVRAIPEETVGESENITENIEKHAFRSEAIPRLNAISTLIKLDSHIVRAPAQLDSDPFLIGVQEGTYNLKEMELLSSEKESLITKRSNASFDTNAQCPRWLQFIEEITCADPELARFLQRALGYSLSGDISEQCFFFLVGSGCNGKSVFLEVARTLLGDYACIAAAETFMSRSYSNSSGPREDLVRLEGQRLVIVTELGENERFNEVFLKQITGGDLLVGRIPHGKSSVEFLPKCKLWFAGNHKPNIYGVDSGIWRRVRLIPFSNDFSNQSDPSLTQTLKEELPGIFNWAIEGFQSWQEIGLQPPHVVQALTSEYRQDQDILQPFIDEKCITGEEEKVANPALYAQYVIWAANNNMRPLSNRVFGKKLSAKNYGTAKINSKRYRTGIGLRHID
jgi:putative DNA primase/helicase